MTYMARHWKQTFGSIWKFSYRNGVTTHLLRATCVRRRDLRLFSHQDGTWHTIWKHTSANIWNHSKRSGVTHPICQMQPVGNTGIRLVRQAACTPRWHITRRKLQGISSKRNVARWFQTKVARGACHSVHRLVLLAVNDVTVVLNNLVRIIYLLLGGICRMTSGDNVRQSCSSTLKIFSEFYFWEYFYCIEEFPEFVWMSYWLVYCLEEP